MPLSTQEHTWVLTNCKGSVMKCWRVTMLWTSIPSRREYQYSLVASYYKNLAIKLQLHGPLGYSADLTFFFFLTQTTGPLLTFSGIFPYQHQLCQKQIDWTMRMWHQGESWNQHTNCESWLIMINFPQNSKPLNRTLSLMTQLFHNTQQNNSTHQLKIFYYPIIIDQY